MNLLVDVLPQTVMVKGQEYEINSCFRTFILFETLIQDNQVEDTEKTKLAFNLFYGKKKPLDERAGFDALLVFYRCGKTIKKSVSGTRFAESKSQAYCFEQDDQYIYSAFLEQYGIDLQDIQYLHWWKFKALFTRLRSDCEICKIMGYRTIKITGSMGKGEQKFYKQMKALYAIDKPTVDNRLSYMEYKNRMLDYVKKRFEDVSK